MKIKLRSNDTPINLTNSDFLAAGGEGKIYAKKDVVYKICEPGKMIPEGKIKELSTINDPNVIVPQDIVLDMKNNVVGYTMKYLKDTYVLGQLFAKAFRVRNNITPDAIFHLIRNMQKRIEQIHKKNILLVDLNELNFLVDQKFKEIFFIDVNSYQTKSYKATAIMDSIRDRHCKNNKFSEGTDWFSFAILSFQLFIGMHPFKGRHNTLKTLDERMLGNMPIINPTVTYPKGACQPFDVIPANYMQWYKAVFEEGKRIPPPQDVKDFIVNVIVKNIVGSNNFDIKELFDFKEVILNYYTFANKEVVVTNESIFFNRKKMNQVKHNPFAKICFTSTLTPVCVNVKDNNLQLTNLETGQPINCQLFVHGTMVYHGVLYAVTSDKILEVKFSEFGGNTIVSFMPVCSVLQQATKIYDGVIIQTLFDSQYISVFPKSGSCHQFALHDIKGKIIDAKYEDQILMIISVDKTGTYHRHVYWFDNNWNKQELIVSNIVNTGLNFTVLDNGVCILINEEEKVEIFHKNNPLNRKVIDDPVVESDMKLISQGSQTMFTRGDKLYSFSMKKGN